MRIVPSRSALQLLLGDDLDLAAVEVLQVGLQLHPVARAVDVLGVRVGEDLDHVAGLVAGAGGVDPVAEDPLDRVAHHVEQPGVRAVGADPLGDALVAGQVGVVRGGLAAHLEAVVEAARVPVEAEVPVQLGDEEVELLRLRHLDFRMEAEVVVDARRAALEAADDDQVRHRRMRLCGGGDGRFCDRRCSARGHGRTSPRRRGLGGSCGGKVCVSVSGTGGASLAAMPVFLVELPVADLASSLEHFFNATTEFFRHLSEVHWYAVRSGAALPAGDAAGARLGVAQRAAGGLSGQADQLHRSWPRPTWPGRGSTRSSRPTRATSPRSSWSNGRSPTPPIRRSPPRSSCRPSSTPRSGSSSSSTRSPRACCRRCPSCPTCPPSRSPSGPTTRRPWRSRSAC